MTHYLRSRHAAILVGVGTAAADDPGLNCRLDDVAALGGPEGMGVEGVSIGQPRPVVLDPRGRWGVEEGSRIITTAIDGKGRGPLWMVGRGLEVVERRRKVVEDAGGEVVEVVADEGGRASWREVFAVLAARGLTSVMVEGGGRVINDLLREENQDLVDGVIITIAPTYLGQGGVLVCPNRVEKGRETVRMRDVKWIPMEEDVVMCGRI
jgi:2,5-diamino-6-(ribosylamino)-4(3H)-pyrimidinone 5'-phosphate reductase